MAADRTTGSYMAESRFYRFTEYIFFAFITVVIVINVLIDNRFYYMYQNNSRLPNVIMFGVFLVFASGFLLAGELIRSKVKFPVTRPSSDFSPTMRLLKWLTLLLFAVQLIYAYEIYFETGWDCRQIVTMAQDIAFNKASIGDAHYFSLYPNNSFLTGIFAGILKVFWLCNIKGAYFPLIFVGALLVSLTGYFMADCVRVLTNRKSLVYIMWIVYVILTGLSPWISIPYSDTYSIFFPTFIIWLYISGRDRVRQEIWGLISFVAFIGYFIKPTVLLTFMALALFEVLHFLFGFNLKHVKENLKKFAIFVLGIVIGAFLAFLARYGMNKAIGFTPDETRSVTPAHYFMMGFNESSGGGYNQEDVNRSFAYPDIKTRNAEDLKEGMARIKGMMPVRIFKFMAQKSLTNFNDGTFGWGNEGDFYWAYFDRDDKISLFLRSFVYHNGANHDIYVAVTQAIWFMTLCFCSLIVIRGHKYRDYRETSILAVMFMIMCFLMIFEARARYLYLYSPVIYMVASIGLKRLIEGRINTEDEGNNC